MEMEYMTKTYLSLKSSVVSLVLSMAKITL